MRGRKKIIEEGGRLREKKKKKGRVATAKPHAGRTGEEKETGEGAQASPRTKGAKKSKFFGEMGGGETQSTGKRELRVKVRIDRGAGKRKTSVDVGVKKRKHKKRPRQSSLPRRTKQKGEEKEYLTLNQFVREGGENGIMEKGGAFTITRSRERKGAVMRGS